MVGGCSIGPCGHIPTAVVVGGRITAVLRSRVATVSRGGISGVIVPRKAVVASTVGGAAVPGQWVWSVISTSLPASVTHDVVRNLSIGDDSIQCSSKHEVVSEREVSFGWRRMINACHLCGFDSIYGQISHYIIAEAWLHRYLSGYFGGK